MRSAGTTGACTLTVNGANADDYASFSSDEFAVSGGNTWALDVDGGSSTGNNTTPTDTLTTLTANALLIGAMTSTGPDPTVDPGTSHTLFGEMESATNNPHGAEFRIVTTATAYTVYFELSVAGGSRNWTINTAAFKEVAGGAACVRRPAPSWGSDANDGGEPGWTGGGNHGGVCLSLGPRMADAGVTQRRAHMDRKADGFLAKPHTLSWQPCFFLLADGLAHRAVRH